MVEIRIEPSWKPVANWVPSGEISKAVMREGGRCGFVCSGSGNSCVGNVIFVGGMLSCGHAIVYESFAYVS